MVAENENGTAEDGVTPSSATQDGQTAEIERADEAPAPEPQREISLVAVAVRAALGAIAVAVLLFGCFLSFFPYTAMRFYSKIDKRELALYNAEKYLRFHSDELDRETGVLPSGFGKYADALYYAVSASVYFMNESIQSEGYDGAQSRDYARKVVTYASDYLDCNVAGSLYERTQSIDEYGKLHSTPALHPYVYSYADTLQTARFKARYLLGDTEELLRRANRATTRWGESDWEPSPDDFLFLAQLSAYIDAEFDRLGLSAAIAKAANGLLLTNNEALGAKAYLYGNSKPFDLLVYDANDVDINGVKYGEGQLTALYSAVTDGFTKCVEYVKSHATEYAPDSAQASASASEAANEHLRYTYYLKTLVDCSRSMNNFAALVSKGNEYFDEQYRTDLRATYNAWQNILWVSGVRTAENDVYQTGRKMLHEWYNWGMLYDYLRFYRV